MDITEITSFKENPKGDSAGLHAMDRPGPEVLKRVSFQDLGSTNCPFRVQSLVLSAQLHLDQ